MRLHALLSRGKSVLAVLGAMTLMFGAVATAEATIVTSPGVQATATNTSPTLFIPNNAYSSIYVSCSSSSAVFTTPSTTNDNNINRTGTGTLSGGPGSVSTLLDEPPSFSGCSVVNTPFTATVNTNDDNGSWSLSALSVEQGQDIDVNIAAIGVPKAGAEIVIDQLACSFSVSPDRASVVTGDYINGEEEDPSTLRLDEQIAFTDGCGLGLASPAQFEGSYEVVDNQGNAVRIDP